MDAFWTFMSETRFMGSTLADIGGKVLLVLIVSLIAWTADRLVSRGVRRALDRAPVPSISIIVNIMRAVVWSLALMTVLEPLFGVQPTAFVTAIGVGSVALSLGMQDTMSNIIGGLSLMASRVIKPGDVIMFAGFTGTVTDINWRATCVVDSYGQLNIIPNSIISKTALIKLSPATKDCCVIQVMIVHGTDLEEARKDLARLADECLGDWVDPERESWITATILDPGGIIAQVSVPLMHGVSADHARTRLAGALSTCDWIKTV